MNKRYTQLAMTIADLQGSIKMLECQIKMLECKHDGDIMFGPEGKSYVSKKCTKCGKMLKLYYLGDRDQRKDIHISVKNTIECIKNRINQLERERDRLNAKIDNARKELHLFDDEIYCNSPL